MNDQNDFRTDPTPQDNPPPRRRSFFYDLLILLVLSLVGTMISVLPMSVIMVTILWNDIMAIMGNLPVNPTPEQLNTAMQSVTELATSNPWVRVISLLFGLLMIGTILVWCRCIRRQPLSVIGLSAGRRAGLQAAVGIGAGILCVAGGVALPVAFKAASLSPSGAAVSAMPVLLAVGLFISGFSQELLYRGYLFMEWRRKLPLWMAVVFSSLVYLCFGIAEGAGIVMYINLLLSGAVLALLCHVTDSVWCSACLHGTVNLLSGIVCGGGLFGTPLLYQVAEGRDLTTGGSFGPEAGLGMTLVWLVLLFLLIARLLPKKDGRGTG